MREEKTKIFFFFSLKKKNLSFIFLFFNFPEKKDGQIRVKSNENLFENYKAQQHSSSLSLLRKKKSSSIDDSQLPKSLKFNRKTMSISVKSKQSLNNDDDDDFNDDDDDNFNDDDPDDDTLIIDNDYENIICSPNFIEQLSCNDDCDDDELLIENDDDDFIIEDDICFSEDSKLPPLVPFQPNLNNNSGDFNLLTEITSSGGGGTVNQKIKNEKLKEKLNFENFLLNGGPPPSQFVLRNPRGNQPRTYNSDALWAALMDVKSGESIYRASQMHKVPRKTLRNWMKRWDIKSAFPMPRQLRQAAEKRKASKKEGAIASAFYKKE